MSLTVSESVSQQNALVQELISQKLWADVIPSVQFYILLAPILIFVIGALTTLIVGVFTSDPEKPSPSAWIIALSTSFLSSVVSLLNWFEKPALFINNSIIADQTSQLAFFILSVGTLLTVFAARATIIGSQLLRSELMALLLLTTCGLMVIASSAEFASFFIGLEIASISLYILSGYQNKNPKSLEAALKYFLTGSCASALILMGAALIYSCHGLLMWSHFFDFQISVNNPLGLLGTLMFLSGLAFKLGLAPFHFWAPDVYQAASPSLTSYMSAFIKFSICLLFIRLLGQSNYHYSEHVVTVFWILAILSIIVGSLFGLVQNSIRRILGYSSIANAGYLALALVCLASNPHAIDIKRTIIIYSVVYALLSWGSFSVLAWIEDGGREDLSRDELAGLGKRRPAAAVMFSIILFGLAGIPPLAGFMGKFFIVKTAIENGFAGLALLLIIGSAFALYYYISIMSHIWFKAPAPHSVKEEVGGEAGIGIGTLALICIVASVILGCLGPVFAFSMEFPSIASLMAFKK